MDLDSTDKLLISSYEKDLSLGLAYGKMGASIYFFYLSKQRKNAECRKIAEKYLKDVFQEIDQVKSIDVKNGLAGIGLGIHYLIKNKYIKGNINHVLENIDDIVFKNLCYPKYNASLDNISICQLLLYLYIRLKELEKHEQKCLFEELTIQTVNNLYERIESIFFEEPLRFDINYQLPQFLFLISKIGSLNFYYDKIVKILEELSPRILSTIPILHSNKLYFLAAIDTGVKVFNIENWERHLKLIKREIKPRMIFEKEIQKDNISLENGLAGIFLLLDRTKAYFHDAEEYKNYIVAQVNSSNVKKLFENPAYVMQRKGLISGLSGARIVLKI